MIGNTAGDIWHYIHTHGSSSTMMIKAALGIPNSILYLALGWLSREGKITMEKAGHAYTIILKNDSASV